MPYRGKWPKWFDTAKVGDVLETPTGEYRVIRGITRFKSSLVRRHELIFFKFAIRRCSWTRRPTTTKTGTQVRDWKHTGHRVKLDTKLDRQIAEEVGKNLFDDKRKIFCCDVKYAL